MFNLINIELVFIKVLILIIVIIIINVLTLITCEYLIIAIPLLY